MKPIAFKGIRNLFLIVLLLSTIFGCSTTTPSIEEQIGYDRYLAAINEQAAGRWYAAADKWNKILEDYPEYEKGWVNLGVCYDGLKQAERAVDAYEQALKLNPNILQAKLNLAIDYLVLRNAERAVSLLQEVTEENQDYHFGWYNLAAAESSLGYHTKALVAIERCLELVEGSGADPTEIPQANYMYEMKIDILIDLGRFQEAWSIVDYMKALELPVRDYIYERFEEKDS